MKDDYNQGLNAAKVLELILGGLTEEQQKELLRKGLSSEDLYIASRRALTRERLIKLSRAPVTINFSDTLKITGGLQEITTGEPDNLPRFRFIYRKHPSILVFSRVYTRETPIIAPNEPNQNRECVFLTRQGLFRKIYSLPQRNTLNCNAYLVDHRSRLEPTSYEEFDKFLKSLRL